MVQSASNRLYFQPGGFPVSVSFCFYAEPLISIMCLAAYGRLRRLPSIISCRSGLALSLPGRGGLYSPFAFLSLVKRSETHAPLQCMGRWTSRTAPHNFEPCVSGSFLTKSVCWIPSQFSLLCRNQTSDSVSGPHRVPIFTLLRLQILGTMAVGPQKFSRSSCSTRIMPRTTPPAACFNKTVLTPRYSPAFLVSSRLLSVQGANSRHCLPGKCSSPPG